MLTGNNNDYHYNEREKKVIELYNQGKSTRDIAKELRMYLRDISTALKDNQVNHGIVITATICSFSRSYQRTCYKDHLLSPYS
jgi:hypothetical protein